MRHSFSLFIVAAILGGACKETGSPTQTTQGAVPVYPVAAMDTMSFNKIMLAQDTILLTDGSDTLLQAPVQFQSDSLVSELYVRSHSKAFEKDNIVYTMIKKDGMLFANGFETSLENLGEEIDVLRLAYPKERTLVFINVEQNASPLAYFYLKTALFNYRDKLAHELFDRYYNELDKQQKASFDTVFLISPMEYIYNAGKTGADCHCY